ncbi:EpsG family protein [Chryseobacterium scophthalmum]|uniref:EpsG family protein n=1 Tax=Chryseobacterium scophthalmum TaxID=59733 RepID=A0A1N6I9G0_9FLAO|nr:EpsG family protein [Chryseobacterium scophthalmum]SIO28640.1 EpsG family protein [Chryseobacterium scophthalmum]
MISIFFAIFISFSVLYFIDIKNKTITNIVLLLLGLALALIAGFRDKGFDKDYYIYKAFWMTTKLKGNVEYSFYLIRNFIKSDLGLGFQYLLLIYAIIGVTIKFVAIKKLSPLVWGSFLIYVSNYYMLHEFTQIRIGVATGFLLLSLIYLADKKYITFYVFAGLAILFHQSCFLVVMFPLFANSEKNLKFYYWIIPFGYFFYFFNTVMDIKIPIPSIQEKIDFYEVATESGFMKESKTNVFNALFLIRIVIFYGLLYYTKKISEHFTNIYLLIKLYAISLFLFIFLSKIPVFSFRIQELIGVVEIIIIPCLIYIFPKQFKFLGLILVFSIALVFFLMNIYYVKLIVK